MKRVRKTAGCIEQGPMRGSTGCAATRASHVTEEVNMDARKLLTVMAKVGTSREPYSFRLFTNLLLIDPNRS